MKKLKLIALTLAVALVPFLQSCLDDGDEYYSDIAIATVRQLDTDDIYFGLDNGEKMYPSDKTAVLNYPFADGKRVFVCFNQLDEKVPGYEYNIKVERIDSILTKKIIPLTEETADSIGDNRINVTHRWIAQGYLTMEFQYYGTHRPDKKHMLNLVYDESKELVDNEGYINLEFRHNAYNDFEADPGEGLVSFNLDKVATEMETAKGLKVRVNTIYDGVQYYKIDFKKKPESNTSTNKQFKASDTFRTNY